MSQFGLYLHWHDMAKIAYSEYKIAQKNNGNLASYQVKKMLLLMNKLKKNFCSRCHLWKLSFQTSLNGPS